MQVLTLWWTSIPRNLNVWAAYVSNITCPIYTVLLQSTWSVPYTVQVLWELPNSFSVYVWLRTKELHTNKEIQGKDLKKSLSDWVLKMTFVLASLYTVWLVLKEVAFFFLNLCTRFYQPLWNRLFLFCLRGICVLWYHLQFMCGQTELTFLQGNFQSLFYLVLLPWRESQQCPLEYYLASY